MKISWLSELMGWGAQTLVRTRSLDLFSTNTGAAYVYSRQSNTLSWSCQYQLSVGDPNSYGGKAVDLNEDNIFVSKTGYSSSAGMLSGSILPSTLHREKGQ
jgi:uncharacterized protein (DUF2147 family)